MRISVVVPAYNEEKTVAQVLEMLSRVPLDLEVIVVDHASTDRTLFGAIFHFLKWLDGKMLAHLILASLWVALATLVRYEGWLMAFMCMGIIVIEYLIVNKNREKAQSYAILFGTLGLFGRLLWLIWNMLFWNNPFNFLTAGKSKPVSSG